MAGDWPRRPLIEGPALLLVSVLVLVEVAQVHAVVREYYVAAVEEIWDYAPSGKDLMPYVSTRKNGYSQSSAADIYLQQGPQRIGRKYKKIMYREYTDRSFTVQRPREAWLGFLGPLIAGERGDVIRVWFKNMGNRNYSMHPHGLQYLKNSEGTPYQDGTSGSDKADDFVAPGQVYMYEWLVTESSSPTADDEDCLTWVYHSHVDTPRDTNSGLIGILITCKPGTLHTLKQKYRQFVLFLNVLDENDSWYIDDNIWTFTTAPSTVDKGDPDFVESNKMHGINGLVYGNLEGLKACVGDNVLWHLVGFGTEVDIHTLSISGHSFLSDKHRIDSVSMNPVDFMTATMQVNTPGKWRINCNINDHITAGMVAVLSALQCTNKAAKSYSPDNSQTLRSYHIGINILEWDYAPSGRDLFGGTALTQPGSASELYAKKDNAHIGTQYYKALYREYTDATFKHQKARGPDEVHLGFLGPVLRAEVDDVVVVTLRNNADRPYSIHPHGAVLVKMYEGALYNDSNDFKQDDLVAPGHTVTLYWYIPENMGPGPADPPCITRLYTSSSLDIVRDSYAGLVGPILVCRRGALGSDNKQKQIDREFFLMYSITDENKSWYIDFNRQVAEISSNVNPADPDFVESNRKHGINGYIYGNLPGLEMCAGDRVSWHVFSQGTEADVHTVYFHGHDFTDFDTHRSAVVILPGMAKPLYMRAVNPGEWAVVCRTNAHYRAGTLALYNVSNECGLRREYDMGPNDVFNRPPRVYYIQAEEENWDFAPSGINQITGGRLDSPDFGGYIFTRTDPPFLGTVYKKVRYHQYTDDTFSEKIRRETDEEFMGILGPTIIAEVLDTVVVHFRNKASRPYSIHAQGLFYNKRFEGSSYGSDARAGRAVDPGQTVAYVWSVPVDYAPATGDTNCIAQAYYSAVDPTRDINSGLVGNLNLHVKYKKRNGFYNHCYDQKRTYETSWNPALVFFRTGPLVICKPGILNAYGRRTDVAKSAPLLFSIFDENESWYLEENIRRAGNDVSATLANPYFHESNLMHSINGYIYGNSPELYIPQYLLVDWQLMTLGSQLDIHDVHFHGNEITVHESGTHHRDVTQLYPGIFRDVTMNATMTGRWLLHCHVHDHVKAGMESFYTVVDYNTHSAQPSVW